MLNITKNYNGIDCTFHKIGNLIVNPNQIIASVWSYKDEASEQNGEDYINETIFTFDPTEIDKENLISDLYNRITL